MQLATLRSGKVLNYVASQDVKDFKLFFSNLNAAEKFDLYLIYQYLLISFKRKQYRDKVTLIWWEARFEIILNMCPRDFLEESKSNLRLHPLKEQLKFAHHMIDKFWRIPDF